MCNTFQGQVMRDISDAKNLVTIDVIIEKTGVKLSTLKAWVLQGHIPAVKIGRRLLFDPKKTIMAHIKLKNSRRPPDMLTSYQVAKLFHMDRSTIARHACEGKIKGHKISGHWFFYEKDIMEYTGSRN